MKDTVNAGRSLYWTTGGAPVKYHWIDEDLTGAVAVVGGGIAGAMLTLTLARAGHDVILISERPIGHGATASAMGVVSGQSGGLFTALVEKAGFEAAQCLWARCQSALGQLDELVQSTAQEIGYTACDALLYTDCPDRAESLNAELNARQRAGFSAVSLNTAAARAFPFAVSSGILSAGTARLCNPYLLTHALCSSAVAAGARIFENTTVRSIGKQDGLYTLHTNEGQTVRCPQVALTTGLSESAPLDGLVHSHTAFTVVSPPLGNPGLPGAIQSACGLRARGTPDGRIMLSGLDCSLSGGLNGLLPTKRLRQKKLAELKERLWSLFPVTTGLEPEFSYCHDYACTLDGLPVIGSYDDALYYVLCTGDNGVAHAVLAAELMSSELNGTPDHDMDWFAPDREGE